MLSEPCALVLLTTFNSTNVPMGALPMGVGLPLSRLLTQYIPQA